MRDHIDKKLVVPSGFFYFASDGGLFWMQADDVECDFAQGRQVLRPVILAVSGSIFAEGDIKNPMQLVLDAPVGSGDRMLSSCATASMPGNAMSVAATTVARRILGPVMDIGVDRLDPVRIDDGLDMASCLGKQGRLAALACQGIVGIGIENGIGGIGPARQGIGGDHAAVQRQAGQSLQHAFDFIAIGSPFRPMTIC